MPLAQKATTWPCSGKSNTYYIDHIRRIPTVVNVDRAQHSAGAAVHPQQDFQFSLFEHATSRNV